MIDTIIHRWLHIPYRLASIEYARPRRPRATILLLHGIGSSSRMWDEVAAKLPPDARIIAVDLLGFGESPKPRWKTYNVRSQARSLIYTLHHLRIYGPVIIVGHSLGALVAIELAKRYKFAVRQLILCSPPFYRSSSRVGFILKPENILLSIYKSANKYPAGAAKVLAFASKYNHANAGFKVDDSNLASFLATLEASIVNQSSLDDAVRLTRSMTVFSGLFDIFVIDRYLRHLKANNTNTALHTLPTGHEITGLYRSAVVKSIKQAVSKV